jgi:hypothetical protein
MIQHALIEIAPGFPNDDIEQPFQIIAAEEGDAQRAPFVAELLNSDIGLKMLSKQLLDAACGRIR